MYRSDRCRRCNIPCSSSSTKCTECELACYCSPKCKADDKWRHEVDCEVQKKLKKCSCCGDVSKETRQSRCARCQQVSYCSKTCQEKDWLHHKPHCRRICKEIISLAGEMNARWSVRLLIGVTPHTPIYYWGNMPAVDLINLSLNEGSDYDRPLSLLLCGVGDMRNVALSVASVPEGYQERLTFVLNDISICTLARTVLLLYMLLEGGEEAAQNVTQVWYSVRISELGHSLLTSALQRLVLAPSLVELTGGVISANAEHFATLKRVWQTWLDLSSRDGAWITEERSKALDRDFGARTGIPFYLAEIPTENRTSGKEWFDGGILLPEKSRNGAKRENVTLMGSSDLTASGPDVRFTYCIPTDCTPFTSWDYKDVKAFHNCPSLLEGYSDYVNHVLTQCASRLVIGQVKLHCILSNCLEMQPFLPDGVAFDRVLTTNLIDYIPLPTVLELCKPLLNGANPYSVIVTETLNWVTYYFPEIARTIMMDASMGFRAETALRDTGNPTIAYSSGRIGFTEYYDFSAEFQRFLRAALMSQVKVDLPPGKQMVPLQDQALKHGVILRNYLQNGNRVFPFKWPINCRRVTQLNGFERAVEWVLPSASACEQKK